MNRDRAMIKHVLDLANMMGHKPNPDRMTLDEIVKAKTFKEGREASFFHTIKILDDRGLIVVDKSQNQDASFWTLDRLTWDGHDYLDSLSEKAQQ
ncbi:DUF2513 domain-containing protein [Pseudomonas lini]|jgi:hypothetical protein